MNGAVLVGVSALACVAHIAAFAILVSSPIVTAIMVHKDYRKGTEPTGESAPTISAT
jgi:hypothetical protein